MHAFNKELKESGAFVASEGLGFPDQARIVRAASDGTPITDGVFPESRANFGARPSFFVSVAVSG